MSFFNEGKMREALEKIAAMDPKGIRADDLGRAARIAREALDAVGKSLTSGASSQAPESAGNQTGGSK